MIRGRRCPVGTVTDRVTEEALSLPAEARLSLVEKLLCSLNLPIDAEIDRLWAAEAEDRVAQVEAGAAKLIPGEAVFAKIRSLRAK
jgi:putative addiction module component (TIGR02574 family)